MTDGYKQLEKDINMFHDSIRELSQKINSAGLIWKDSKYVELKQSISHMASDSKEVLQAGESLQWSISRFEAISRED